MRVFIKLQQPRHSDIVIVILCSSVCVCFALRRVCVKETTFIFVVLPSCKIAVIHAASSVLTCKGIAR